MPVHRLWRCVLVALLLSVGGPLSLPSLRAQSDPERPHAVLTKLPSLALEVWPADFNEDGITDLVAGRVSGDIVVRLGLGDGAFAGEQPISFGIGFPVGVGDLNRDGFIDILSSIVQPNGTVTATYILSGNGNGTFAPAVASSLRVDAPAYVVDFDGDAVQDVVGLGVDEVRVYPGISDFVFGTPSVMRTGIMPANLVPADLNADGLLDVAAVNQNGRSVDVLINVGGFDFTGTTIPLGHQGLGITAGDMDNDGIIDLVASGGDLVGSVVMYWSSGFVFFLRGNGDGTFQSPIAFATNRGPRSVVIGDFNGDGRRDVATGNLSYDRACDSREHLWDSVSFLPGFGDGRLGPAASYALGNREDPPDITLYRHAHHRLNTSDLNADGRTDLIASPGAILLSTPPSENGSPQADAGESQMVPSGSLTIQLQGSAVDPDNDWLTFQWTDATGQVVGTVARPCIPERSAAQQFTLTVTDGRGGVSVDTVTNTSPLPGGWSGGDIGQVGRPGSTSWNGAVFTVRGSGADIWGTSDAFQFASSLVTGDFDVVTRVISVEHVHEWTKAGLMIRDGLSPAARHAFVFATPSSTNGVAFQRRQAAGNVTVHTAGPAVTPPIWLRLRREGDAVTAFTRASDAEPWALVGTQTFDGLPSSVQVGLAVTSHVDGTLATATFDDFAVTPIVSTLPPGWTSTDVGAVAAAGRATHDGATFTVDATGADIWDFADAFHFAYVALSGDFEMRGRVTSLAGPDPWSKAGLMIRESLAPAAAHHFLLASSQNGLAHQWRPSAGGATLHEGIGTNPLPAWFRIGRYGGTLTLSYSADGATWTHVASAPFANGEVLVGLAVTSHDVAQAASATFDNLQVTLGPAPWTSANVGNVGVQGSTTFDGVTYTLSGNGSDIWDTIDAFRFMHQPMTGDGSITARVVTFQATNTWAKAGVMIRASLDPSAAHAFMFVSLSEGAAFQRRVDQGGLTAHTGAGAAIPPQWVRLTRAGAVVSAEISTDGTNWTTVGSDTFTDLPATAFVGLAVTSHENGSLATASFDQLRVQSTQPSVLAITSPAPGSSLTVTPVTFKWNGAGDEFWLDIGSAPGASDFYTSGSLGSQTQHTVTRMPLHGGPLYVQVRRRRGTVVDVVSAQYTAPIRKGLAVITDFSDRRLEDWTGSGMNSVEDVSAMVGSMADHWAWLSRGRERIQWDIIRVRIPAPLSPDPFQGHWVNFRNAVANLIKQQVATADYDVDVDGEIDAAWIIVSNGNTDIPSAIGGASMNGGVNIFVDGQSSVSVVAGAIGNFNHELAHLLGIPDLYGPYDTIHTLTLMSYSWPVPPPDFTAWERIRLGWLDPQVVTQTTRGVWLPSAHEVLAAVRIPTARPSEYFLIEYRRRPETGYGSAEAVPFNGLAVYHVLEGASMWTDPPIIQLEPADGVIVPGNQPLSVFDFVYPENPYMLRPLVLRSHFDGAPIVFQIENVMWRDGGLAFDIVMPDAAASSN